MKKTLLLSLISASSLLLAQGDIKLITTSESNSIKLEKDKTYDTNVKLLANIKKENIYGEMKLGLKSQSDEITKAFDFISVSEGFVKLGYDDNKIAASIKYDFSTNSKQGAYLDGSYTYMNEQFMVKPKIQVASYKFNPLSLKLGNDVEFKANDKLKLNNNLNFMLAKDIIYDIELDNEDNESKIFEDYYNEIQHKLHNSYSTNLKKLFEINGNLGLAYTPIDSVKLSANLYGAYNNANLEIKKDDSINIYDYVAHTSKPLEADKKLTINRFDINPTLKAEYKSSFGLMADALLDYKYFRLIKEENGMHNAHLFKLDSNVSYDLKFNDKIGLRLAGNLVYLYDFIDEHYYKDNKMALYEAEDHSRLILNPNVDLMYKGDKFSSSLKAEVPFVYAGTSKYKADGKKVDSDLDGLNYDKGTARVTLTLGYNW